MFLEYDRKKQTFLQLLTLTVGLLFVTMGWSQDKTIGSQIDLPDATSDTLLTDDALDQTFYEIELLRLERWIVDNVQRFFDPVLLKEVARLKEEAEDYAANGDYALAVIWMDLIWELLEHDPETGQPSELQFEEDETLIGNPGPGSPNRLSWSKEILTGIDLWQHQFQFSVPEGDSTVSTSFDSDGGNPYTGFRLSFDYSADSRQSFRGFTTFKYSRDYLNGELDLRFVNPIGPHSFLKWENRLAGNSFYRESNLRYLQNLTSLAIKLNRIGRFSLDLEDEFLIRKYGEELGIYPNYFNNTLKSFLRMELGAGSFLGAGYRNIYRKHPNFSINDYRENRIDLSWSQLLGRDGIISLDNELRFRDYTNVEIDTFFQDYTEDYFRGDVRLPFTRRFGMQLEGSLTKRDYKLLGVNSLPGFLFWEINPELYTRLGTDWKIGAGILYRSQTYEELINRLASFDGDVDAARGISFEDFYAVGPAFSLEFFQVNGVILTLEYNFLVQRYRNNVSNAASVLDIYPDRNINSILLFLSWTVTPRWRVTGLANLDDERSRREDNADSRNTLVGFELSYLF